MTKEEFLKKREERYDEKELMVRDSRETKLKRIYANNVFEKIVGKIENADLDMCYKLENEETKNLPICFFDDKLEELKQRYDFLEFSVIRNQVYGGDIVRVEWKIIEYCDYYE